VSSSTSKALTGRYPRTAAGRGVAPYSERETVLVMVAALAVIGALIHIGAAVDHWAEYHLYTVVFAAIATLQVLWAVLILRGASDRILVAGCVLQLGTAALWAVSRTVGVPLAPTAWVPEEVGLPDLMETLGELATVAAVASVLLAGRFDLARRARKLFPGALLVVILLSALFGTGAHAG
jgi:hypothetical protein